MSSAGPTLVALARATAIAAYARNSQRAYNEPAPSRIPSGEFHHASRISDNGAVHLAGRRRRRQGALPIKIGDDVDRRAVAISGAPGGDKDESLFQRTRRSRDLPAEWATRGSGPVAAGLFY